MTYHVWTRVVSCLLCLCLLVYGSTPAAAAQEREETASLLPLSEHVLDSFANVPVGDPETEPPMETAESSGPQKMPLVETEPSAPQKAPAAPAGVLASYDAVMEWDGVSYIVIESEEELRKIGSGEAVPNTGVLGMGARHYTADEDYVLVEDLTLTQPWTPLDFCGTLIGAQVNGDGLQEAQRVVSNVQVQMGSDSGNGVGFFGALYSKGVADEMEEGIGGDGLLGGLLSGLLGVVGGLLGVVTGLLGDVAGLLVGWEEVTALAFEPACVKNLVLEEVTLPEVTDSDVPVGAFAGQVSGDVTVERCEVRQVKNLAGQQWVGGFMGKTVGATSYLLNGTLSGLEGTLGGVGSIVDSVLNLLLPTEDLVGNLIEELGVSKLIPVGYDPVKLIDCAVVFSQDGGAVTASAGYAGGFAGRLQGTRAERCSVSGVRSVTASDNVGGFAGRVNNAPIVGLLQGLGVNLVDFPAGCVLTDCTADGVSLRVISTRDGTQEGANLAYAGGFAGAIMASTVTVSGDAARCGVSGLQSVEANGSDVGGFAGYAGIGDLAEALNLLDKTLNLELKDDGSLELGSALTDLLDQALGVNLDAGVLSLIGIRASQLAGCSVEGESYTVAGDQRVGGFVGYLQGGQIVEQAVERQYSRTQLTDSEGRPVYVSAQEITENGLVRNGELISACYGRLENGQIVLEDVHGNAWNLTPLTEVDGRPVYHVYDSVYLDAQGNPAQTSTFRNEDWSAVLQDGKTVSNRRDLPDGDSAVVPVYQQATDSRGRVRFTYYSESGAQIVYRDSETPSLFYGEDGAPVIISEENGLASDTLQTAVEDSLEDSGAVTASYLTTITGLSSVSGSDYVGGVVGQATLASAVDLVSGLTAVQYERFELNCVRLTGAASGYTVSASGARAGGVAGYAMGGDVADVQAAGLAAVSATSFAGGFAGQILPGTVAGQDGQGLQLLGLVTVSNLLTVVDAVHTFVNDSSVAGIDGGFTVSAQNDEKNGAAAGFVAWSVNSHYSGCTVSGLRLAEGGGYAGGFCAMAETGNIAGVMDQASGDLNLAELLGVTKLLSLLQSFPNRFTGCTVNVGSGPAYTVRAVPAGASETPGERVNAQNREAVNGTACGSAGGFLGYGTAVQVTDCANENLAAVDATSFAGGFAGCVTIGSLAQIGSAGLVGEIASVTGIAALLDCAASILRTSHCQGTAGGYTVSAFDRATHSGGQSWTDEGMAGGFAGNVEGSHIEGCYANHLDTVRGEENAGGFLGRMVPGDVAKAADGTSVLDGILQIDGGLLSALQVMVPSVKNSYAKCVPCGGTVLAYGTDYDAAAGATEKIGVAGGFVGLSAGGQIWGNDENAGTVADRAAKTGDYSGNAAGQELQVYGTGQTCDILQLLRVDASRYAGGYSGYTKAADLASLGDVKLLDGLVDLGNLLSVGQVVVPTQRNTGVTGPLRNVNEGQMAYFEEQPNFAQADFTRYYGYTVGSEQTEAAGGYCGVMTTGVVENSVAYDLIAVQAVSQAGGFVGAMITGGVAHADVETSLLGGLLGGVSSVTSDLLGLVDAIVPVIRSSGVYGYASGSRVTAFDGSAGGFAGAVEGGQIWGEANPEGFVEDGSCPARTYCAVPRSCFTKHLRSVSASGTFSDAGGFAGSLGAASVASVGGLELLGLIELPTDLLTLLSATVPTVYYAETSAVDDWGFTVSGGRSAGGFAGFLQGAQVGVKETPTVVGAGDSSDAPDGAQNVAVTGLRSVTAGDYAGGFFGCADAAETLDVSAPDEGGGNESFTLLELVSLGGVSAIELAKTYVYHAGVSGVAEGYQVESANAYAWKTAQWDEDKDKAACAGGFGGLLQAGIVRYCTADGLSLVSGKNDAGGFVARMGKSSILKVDDLATRDDLGILGSLLTLGVGVGEVFGSHVQDSRLTGAAQGYSVLAQDGYHEIAGGFVGYADVCRVRNCAAAQLRLVASDEIAGGFMGAMSDAMLISLDLGLLQNLLQGITASVDLIKANRSRIENATVTGVDAWDGYDVYGGGSGETSDADNSMGYAGAFLGLNFGSTVTNGSAYYADTVKGTAGCVQPYVGTQENTALLTNLQLDVLWNLIDYKGDLSRSEIENSSFETRAGDTPQPSGAAQVVSYDGTLPLERLPAPYFVADNEADLMVRDVTHTLTITKELRYEAGAVPNLADLDYRYTVGIYDGGGALVAAVSLRPGESAVLENLPAGTYTVRETAASILPGNVLPSGETTVTVTAGQDAQVTVVNVVTAAGKAPPGQGGGYAASQGKFLVNHIPTGGQEPGAIANPCEVLHEEAAPPISQEGVNGIAVEKGAKPKRDPDENTEEG